MNEEDDPAEEEERRKEGKILETPVRTSRRRHEGAAEINAGEVCGLSWCACAHELACDEGEWNGGRRRAWCACVCVCV